MTNKHSQDNKATPTSLSELTQLRQIVFGDAQQGLEQKIAQLEQAFKAQIKTHEQQTNRQLSQLQQTIENHVHQLEDKLLNADKGQDAKADELFTLNKNLSSELEMAEAAHKQDTDEIHKRIDQELGSLSNQFAEKLKQALAQIAQVSHELNTSKTDRKTLAKLLSTVASNLETDDGE